MRTFAIFLSLFFTACASTPKTTGYIAPDCGQTALNESDLKPLGFKPAPGKVVVMRVFATWCPFCKIDLAHIGDLYHSKTWRTDKVQLFLLAYRTHGETRDTVEAFQRDDLKNFGIPAGTAQVIYVDQDVAQVKAMKSASGQALFSGLAGLPFGLVFGKDGRLAYRGQFTTSDVEEKRQYDFVTGLQNESCGGR